MLTTPDPEKVDLSAVKFANDVVEDGPFGQAAMRCLKCGSDRYDPSVSICRGCGNSDLSRMDHAINLTESEMAQLLTTYGKHLPTWWEIEGVTLNREEIGVLFDYLKKFIVIDPHRGGKTAIAAIFNKLRMEVLPNGL